MAHVSVVGVRWNLEAWGLENGFRWKDEARGNRKSRAGGARGEIRVACKERMPDTTGGMRC